jgi:hypothetical protein
MWYSPDSLALIASLVLLAPSESLSASHVIPRVAASAARIAACDAPTLSLPESIELSPDLRTLIRESLEHSPSFRRQCRELAAAPHLRAKVRINYHPFPGSPVRALTTFRQVRSGRVNAEIEIRSALDLTELLAHEFEHVLEQVEGTDLDALTTTKDAKRLPDGTFETRRAIEAGRRVAREVIDNAPDRMRDAGTSVWRTFRRAVGAGHRTAPASGSVR